MKLVRSWRLFVGVALLLAAVLAIGGFRVWRVRQGGTIDTGARLQTIAYSPDGSLIATINAERGELWDSASGSSVARLEPTKLASSPVALAFSPSGKWLAGIDEENEVALWSGVDGHLVKTFTNERHRHEKPIPGFNTLFFAPSEKLLAVHHARGFELWSIPDGKLEREHDRISARGSIACFAGNDDEQIELVESDLFEHEHVIASTFLATRTGAQVRQVKSAPIPFGHVLGFQARRTDLAFADLDTELDVYANPSGQLVGKFPYDWKTFVQLAASADGEVLAYASGTFVELRATQGGGLIRRFDAPPALTNETVGRGVALSPARDVVAIAWGERVFLYPFRR